MSDGWLVEQGIGEERAILYDNGHAVAARLRWPGRLEPGQVAEGRISIKAAGWRRGTVDFAPGLQATADRLPKEAREGDTMRFRVIRGPQTERIRLKSAVVRATDERLRAAPTLAESLPGARVVHRFPDNAWLGLWDSALDGVHDFSGGNLELTPASAMTLIDVDGHLPPHDLALAAVPAIAEAIALLGIGGSVGIDFPTLDRKVDRKAVDEALGMALDGIDHERTAMNGFGFVQIVMRYERPSILQLVQNDMVRATARLLLWKAERLEGAGKIELMAHPDVIKHLRSEWLDELSRRSGREVLIRPEITLAIESAHAQLVPL